MPYSDPAKNREAKRNWRRANPDYMAEYMRQRRAANPQPHNYRWDKPGQVKAHQAVKYALKTGKLIRPDYCQECSSDRRLNAHHHLGYEWPLEVQWLCVSCHKKADGHWVG